MKKLSSVLELGSAQTKIQAAYVSTWVLANPCFHLLPLSSKLDVFLFAIGDNNLCNVVQLSPCSPTKKSKKENSFPPATPKGRRLFFSERSGPTSPNKTSSLGASPLQRDQETPKPSQLHLPRKELVCTRLFKQEGG